MTAKTASSLREVSIRAALDFIESQKASEEPQWSLRRVALEYGLPPQTLRDAVPRGGPAKRPGPSTILTAEEENEIVGYCLNMQKLGFGLTKPAVNTMIMEILRNNPRPHSFKDKPGKALWERFMRDHKELSFRVPQELTAARAAKSNPLVIQNHFAELQRIIRDNNLSAERIWNMDESGFSVSSRLQKVLAQKNSRQVHKIATRNSIEHLSVCPTISAAGAFIPPLLIYKGSNVRQDLLSGASVPSGTVAAFTDTGYMHESVFRMYIEHFIKSIPPQRPAMLMLDGHACHIDLISINLCRDNDILLYVLPSNTTHVLQPSEIPFKKLKLEFDKAADRCRAENGPRVITKYRFAGVFGEVFYETYTPAAIRKAYAATGIWPLNPSVIKDDRMAPSIPTCKPGTPSVSPKKVRKTRAGKIVELEEKIHKLEEHVSRLEHPGTASLALILKYPLSAPYRRKILIHGPRPSNLALW